jgi:hypothetical protein
VRRCDLDTWIGTRQVKPIRGFEDADIERRMARLAGRTTASTGARRPNGVMRPASAFFEVAAAPLKRGR